MEQPKHWQKIRQEDRKALFKNAMGEEKVCLGDGEQLPYRQFLDTRVHDIAQPYFLSPKSNVTAVDGRKLAGFTGALLARQSRAKGTVVDVLVNEFLVTSEEESEKLNVPVGELREGKLDKLIERILIQFGDDSVQELEYSTVLFNSVSNLATKAIEDRRLGAYIEQSSRYVLYTEKDPVTDGWYYYRDADIMRSSLRNDYLRVMDRCFELYTELTEKLQDYYRTLKPIDEVEYAIKPKDDVKYRFDELETEQLRKAFRRSYKFDIRTRACDTARIMLPAATLTNVAMVANGRTFEHLLKRLYSSNKKELKDVANRLHGTLNEIIPKYVKRANPGGEAFWMETDKAIRKDIETILPECDRWSGATEEVRVHDVPPLLQKSRTSIEHLLAGVYFPYAKSDYQSILHRLERISEERLITLLQRAIGERSNRRNRSPRGFEHRYDITAEIVGDFGIFRDLHRHRMLMLQWQRPNPYLGFEIPKDIEHIGMADECRSVEKEVRTLYDKIASQLSDDLAEYVVLFGHNIRFMFGMNFREAQHLLELRTVMQGHPNYRRVCQKIHEAMTARAPWLAKTDLLKFVDHNQYHWARSDAEARQSQKAMECGLDI